MTLLRKQFNIELIKKIKKPDTGNNFLNGLLQLLTIVVYPFVLLFGLIFMLLLLITSVFTRLFISKSDKELDKIHDEQYETFKNQWTILTAMNGVEIYNQYAGEIRFGPCYWKLKSKPDISDLSYPPK